MRFALFCKSFGDDVERFARLCRSVRQHNAAALPLIVSVPEHDRALFRRRFAGEHLTLVPDEEILPARESPASRRALSGWRTQQLVKLNFVNLDLADAWLVVDSDFYFIRDFSTSDFIDGSGSVGFITSTMLHRYEGHESEIGLYLGGQSAGDDRFDILDSGPSSATTLGFAPNGGASSARSEPRFPWWLRITDLFLRPSSMLRVLRPQRIFGRSGPYLNFMPGPIWTADSLRSLREDFLRPNGLQFADLIRLCPWESVWVGEWELFRGLPRRHLRAPCFLHFESDLGIAQAKRAGLRVEDFAARYLGLALAARHQDALEY
ncbi:MAG: hypothetical protein IPK13_08050 [Deltaproteobacteria bacterium]|nr:hypothetical protein [Deltaproteobacteria bacterium]